MFLATLLTLSFLTSSSKFEPIKPISWHEASIFQINTNQDPQVEKIVEQYLQDIAQQGYNRNQQGLWIQSEWRTLGDNRGKVPAPAASLTKVATTIASLKTWDLNHRFLTKFYVTGEISKGILQGDLLIEAGGDPLFIWEEAIAVGNQLQEMGIQEIKGNLIATDNWQMNYKTNATESAKLFLQALNAEKWSATIEKQYQTIQPEIPRPQIIIQGKIATIKQKPDSGRLLFTHQSLTLQEILRLMNVYSNNHIAESLAQQIGGGKKVAQIASQVAQVPPEEVLLINGSGLGVDNRISPRAASAMFMALDKMLASTNINLGDLFPVAGVDQTGTIEDRNIPLGIASKTGTLAVVSALSGAIPTVEREKVYFAIINYGNGIDRLRNNQDILLNNLHKHWQLQAITPTKSIKTNFGDRQRNF
jgi:D-alanyl-D-alanine carboxypeptidase/D-alanyl-D-alanine-endopeptidase (penicillin-binding protein 4)